MQCYTTASGGLDIHTYSYNDQAVETDKLIISELSTPVNLQKLESVHLIPYFGLQKQAHAEFKAIYAEQFAANSSLRLVQSASSIRRNLEAALRNSKIGTRTEAPTAPTV